MSRFLERFRSWFADPVEVESRKIELARLRIERARMERVAELEESVVADPAWELRDLAEAWGDPVRQDDRDWPDGGDGRLDYRSENDLARARKQSRKLIGENPYAKGLLRNLTNYIIGSGWKFTAASKTKGGPGNPRVRQAIEEAQDFLDRVLDLNDFDSRQKSMFRRSRRDGETFVRLFWTGESVSIRFVQPEQVRAPDDGAEEWSFGVRRDIDDAETTLAYWVRQQSTDNGEEVSADEIAHLRINTDEEAKRGQPDFGPTECKSLSLALKLVTHLGDSAAIQAAIAWIRKHTTAKETAARRFRDDLTTKAGIDPYTGRKIACQRYGAGTVLDIGSNFDYIAAPTATGNTNGHLSVLQALLRLVAASLNIPEFMVSSDASNANFASTLVAESPFVRYAKEQQSIYKAFFIDILWRAVELAVRHGVLSPDVLEIVEIQAEAPTVETRDRLQEAQVYQIERQNGITSPQTWQQIIGRDPEIEQVHFDEWNERNPGGAGGMLIGQGLPIPSLGGANGTAT